MKNANATKWIAVGLLITIPVVLSYGQLKEVTSQMKNIYGDIKTIMNYVIAICLFLGAGHVIYAWANGSGDMKKILINWMVALIIATVITLIIPAPQG